MKAGIDENEVRGLPKSVDIVKLCQQGTELKGVLKSSNMPRLLVLANGEEPTSTPVLTIHSVLRFGQDIEGHRTVEGSMSADLSLVCQRCMDKFIYPIASEFVCAFVASDEEAKNLPAHLEPAMLQADSTYVDLHELLEDELFLNLPIAPMHEQCDGDGSAKVFGEVKTEIPEKRQLPFTGLAELLKKE